MKSVPTKVYQVFVCCRNTYCRYTDIGSPSTSHTIGNLITDIQISSAGGRLVRASSSGQQVMINAAAMTGKKGDSSPPAGRGTAASQQRQPSGGSCSRPEAHATAQDAHTLFELNIASMITKRVRQTTAQHCTQLKQSLLYNGVLGVNSDI